MNRTLFDSCFVEVISFPGARRLTDCVSPIRYVTADLTQAAFGPVSNISICSAELTENLIFSPQEARFLTSTSF